MLGKGEMGQTRLRARTYVMEINCSEVGTGRNEDTMIRHWLPGVELSGR